MDAPPLTEATFRALARSAPWRWRTLTFSLSTPMSTPPQLRAMVRRTGGVRVELPDGTVETDATSGSASSSAQLSMAWSEDGDATEATTWVPTGVTRSSEVAPELDEWGLVRRRPDPLTVEYDEPYYRDYLWVAMLDPVELADGMDRERAEREGVWPPPAVPGTVLGDLIETERHGRRTWWAEASATKAYEPRCACCAMLFGQVSEALEGRPLDPGVDLPTRYLVGLDVGTGVCVSLDRLDGAAPGSVLSMRIEAVDEPMADALFR